MPSYKLKLKNTVNLLDLYYGALDLGGMQHKT